jgi:phosphoenolpyruvate carboxykinase (diphosphate)
MDAEETIGLTVSANDPESLPGYLNLKLAALGLPTAVTHEGAPGEGIYSALLAHHREAERLLAEYLCPADQRIQSFLDSYLAGTNVKIRLPGRTLILDRCGMARALSIPAGGNEFVSDIVTSYRVRQGVLHNPKNDRRTTQGVFHIAEGGSPIPADKIAVPRDVFANLLLVALDPPSDLMKLPFTASQRDAGECLVSLLLRPLVCPAVPGFVAEKSMETRFFAPGNLVGNLDFVESIFGNAGDPFLPENDAGLDVEHWVGATGCVILAPHLTKIRKQLLGLPHWDNATERQRRDGMCWKSSEELYNHGNAFKITCRDHRGVMVTILADNYFGYCKKEVKTQLSYAANLFGFCEEEHSGGAKVFRSYDLGEEFNSSSHEPAVGHTMESTLALLGDAAVRQAAGHAIDRKFSSVIYVPENSAFDLHGQTVSWIAGNARQSIKLLADKVYVRPSGYRVQMVKPPGNRAWRLIGTVGEPTLCHKPCTVSGGGKSEISKPISDAIIQGPVFVANFEKDFDAVEALLTRDYADRFAHPIKGKEDHRTILSAERSLGSVIKLLTPDTEDFSDAYNQWLLSVPQHVKELVFVVKRFYKPAWEGMWRDHFSVDVINGQPGNELKCEGRKLVSNYLRVGFAADGSWRVFSLRKDFHPAMKVQAEDDITASIVVPGAALPYAKVTDRSLKVVQNCEYRLFQRPDDAIHRGYDKTTENDFARGDTFFSNYEPLTPMAAKEFVEDAIGFVQFTPPMQQVIAEVAETGQPAFFVSCAHPRLVNGKPTKNPRYLQVRPDLKDPQAVYLAEIGERLHRQVPLHEPMVTPVTAVLPGRRNNPPDIDGGIRSLAVYNPVHYMELPELFMEFICSMTGKSPSTTGAGSEGALTKGPFNAMPPIIDLNNALVSFLLTRADGFVTAAGYVGPHCRVDHDISLLVPEVWSRMKTEERDPKFLIEKGCLEKCEDIVVGGRKVLASRLGYRVTLRFINRFFGRVLTLPHIVFTEQMLRPESQDLEVFADGMDNIVATQKRIAQNYFDDGSIEMACPPLRALLHIMRDGVYGDMELSDVRFRGLFTRENLLASGWYADRLKQKQKTDVELWQRHVAYLQSFLEKVSHAREAVRLGIVERSELAKAQLRRVQEPGYLDAIRGTIGADPAGVLR